MPPALTVPGFDPVFPPEPVGVDINQSVLFHAWLEEGVGDAISDNNEGLWLCEGQNMSLIARRGGAVPGQPGKFFLNDRMPNPFLSHENGAVGIDTEFSNDGTNNEEITHTFFCKAKWYFTNRVIKRLVF